MKTFRSIAAALACAAALPANAAELVTNGDFSAGLTGFTTTYTTAVGPGSANQGYVTTTTNPDSLCSSCFPSVVDHTTGSGLMLYVDGAAANTGAFWSQTFDVVANSSYAFSVWAVNLGYTGPIPGLRATVNGTTILNTLVTPYTNNNGSADWVNYTGSFQSGAATSVTLSLFNDTQQFSFNDMVIDDISFQGPAALSAVPEPATWAMMIGGFGLVGGAMRRRATRVAFA
jgi:hypothetical protein